MTIQFTSGTLCTVSTDNPVNNAHFSQLFPGFMLGNRLQQ